MAGEPGYCRYKPTGQAYVNLGGNLLCEFQLFKRAIQPLSDLYAKLPALNFGTTKFEDCRNWWLSDPKRRRTGDSWPLANWGDSGLC